MAKAPADQQKAARELDSRETGDLIAFLFTLDYFDLPGNVENGRRLRLTSPSPRRTGRRIPSRRS